MQSGHELVFNLKKLALVSISFLRDSILLLLYTSDVKCFRDSVCLFFFPEGGRYCEWKHKTIDKSEESATFWDYKRTLKLDCDEGRPGSFTWMPDEDTPDIVYYQV